VGEAARVTRSDQLITFLVAAGVVVGYIVGQAYPAHDAVVPKSLAVLCVLLLALLTLIVLHVRRGRP
jgi:uncharacterized membrane protein YhaH (DUF805 family)